MNSLSSSDPIFDYGILIVTYNNVNEITPCLESLKQAAPDDALQVIVVDNGSTDPTPKILQQFQNSQLSFAEFQLILNEENRGFTAAVNQALRKIRARYILFLNPDTVLNSNSLPGLREILEKEHRVGIIAPQLRNKDGSIQPSCRRFPRHRDVFFSLFGLSAIFPRHPIFNGWKMGDFAHRSTRRVQQPQGACLLAKAEVVGKIGLWDEGFPMFFSDVDWCHRAIEAGYQILFTPQVWVSHDRGKSVFSNRPQMILSSHRSFIRYFWKYFPSLRYFLANFLVSLALYISAVVRFALAKIFKAKEL